MKAADRCPGVLRAHRAEDGLVIRIRLPGGQTSAAALTALSRLAGRFGHDELQLTSRGGIQLRGLPDPVPEEVAARLGEIGLLPSASHERVRNIVASPLSGIAGGLADLRGLVRALDGAVVAEPALAALPGRFLFVLDDGRGDVASRSFDLGYRALDAGSGLVLIAGPGLGFPVAADRAVDRLVDLAGAFLAARGDSGAWHVGELAGWRFALPGVRAVPAPPAAPATPLGAVGAAASVAVPLGRLTPAQVAAVGRVSSGPVVVTPDRGLVVPGAATALSILTGAGLLTDPASPWSLISACVGAPGCASAEGSTRESAVAAVSAGRVRTRTHVTGCDRRCGAPPGPYDELRAGAGERIVVPGKGGP